MPIQEGKAVLFKKFGGVDAFDVEINENDPDKLIDIIASLEVCGPCLPPAPRVLLQRWLYYT